MRIIVGSPSRASSSFPSGPSKVSATQRKSGEGVGDVFSRGAKSFLFIARIVVSQQMIDHELISEVVIRPAPFVADRAREDVGIQLERFQSLPTGVTGFW